LLSLAARFVLKVIPGDALEDSGRSWSHVVAHLSPKIDKNTYKNDVWLRFQGPLVGGGWHLADVGPGLSCCFCQQLALCFGFTLKG